MASRSSVAIAPDVGTCQLCTLPIKSAVVEITGDGNRNFCCSGCRNVWRILEESGQLEGVTDLRETSLYKNAFAAGLLGGTDERPQNAVPTQITAERKGSGLDDQRQCILQVDGMWCSSCSWLISQTLLRSKGVLSADVSFSSDTARIVYLPAKTDESALVKAINGLGYVGSPLGEANDQDPRVLARRREFLRVVISFAFAMNVMMMQWILYAGFFEGIATSIRRGLPWLLFALSVPVFYCSRSIFIKAGRALLQRTATMETLVALGAGSAFAYSIWQMFRGTGHVYFDTADMLLGLVMVGKFIESGVRQNATDALTLLYGLLPRKAIILRENRELAVSIGQLAVGDEVRVKSGERIAADGIVLTGSATVDESLMSGESRPVRKDIGDSVIGGTMLQNGILTVVVGKTAENGVLNQIIQLVQNSLNKKTPAERMADQISRIFVPGVLALAFASGLSLALVSHAPIEEVLTRIVAVLVIACPCALGIATPMAISAGVAFAAQEGVLIADGAALETLSKVQSLVLDKTGTATEGKFEVRDSLWGGNSEYLLAALERCSSHPIANAITTHFETAEPAPHVEVTNYVLEDGIGIFGTIEGQRLFAGNTRAIAKANVQASAEVQEFIKPHEKLGRTIIYWGIEDHAILGVLALGDRLRSGAVEAVMSLKELGITTELISGDSETSTAIAAQQLNIVSWRGAMLPSDKAEWIEKLLRQQDKDNGKVCMVGDGVNDAPALARADVGIALASGTDIASRTAQATLLKPDLNLLPTLIKLSKRTMAIVNQNLFWAFLYNIICIPLAMAGYITPIWAVSAMLISSLTVILNTQRLKR